jgi:hypothetical protein
VDEDDVQVSVLKSLFDMVTLHGMDPFLLSSGPDDVHTNNNDEESEGEHAAQDGGASRFYFD